MTITALSIEQDAYARLNRLSPGETLGPDECLFAFDRLNILVDELGGDNLFLFKDLLTSASVTGASITLGAGSWLAINPGDDIVGAALIDASAGDYGLSPLTMQQYNEQVSLPATTGLPTMYAYDGFATVYLLPVPTAKTIQIQTRTTVSAFADQTTSYTVPTGYRAMLGAELAVRLAPSVLGGVPPALISAAKAARIERFTPAIVDNFSYTRATRRVSILNGV